MKYLMKMVLVLLLVLLISPLFSQPNVVFIIVDDLNTLPYQPDGKPLVPTPNIDRLKEKGVSFTNAHTNDPLCAPSRASMLTGLYPQTSGLYWFENWRQNGILKTSVSLNDNLRNSNYKVYGTGKIYHGGNKALFDEYGYEGDFGPWPWDGRKETARGFTLPHSSQAYLMEGPDSDIDYQWEHTFGPLSDIPEYPASEKTKAPGYKGWVFGGKPWKYETDEDRDLLSDELSVKWAKAIIEQKHQNPYALFVGLVRTHTPLYAPQKYFDKFPLESIKLPEIDPDDLNDVAEALGNEALYGFRRYNMLVRHEGKDLLRHWLQAYMACVSFVDDQVGELLDAIESGPDKNNTLIFLTSDHGFHMGEKNFLYKGSLWEPSTRIPLIIAGAEGMAQGKSCDHPVSLIDIYPTFNELCNLNKNPNKNGNGYKLEGHSLVPFLMETEKGEWEGPNVAITTIPGKNHMHHQVYEGTLFPHFSVRSKRYRYSLTSDGGEELYDHETDPFEWKNLAEKSDYASLKENLKKQLLELRDGDKWISLQDARMWEKDADCEWKSQNGIIQISGEKGAFLTSPYNNFELELYMKTSSNKRCFISYRDGSNAVSSPKSNSKDAQHGRYVAGEWNKYRIRVVNNRHQLWINDRVVKDEKEENKMWKEGKLTIKGEDSSELLQVKDARIRVL